jgi:hypothetical protein
MMGLQYLLSKFLLSFVDISIELVSILSNREFLVVINWDVYLLVAHRFIFWVVKLRHIWVS